MSNSGTPSADTLPNVAAHLPSMFMSWRTRLPSHVLAIRPWSLSASIIPTLLGCTIAHKLNQSIEFSLLTLLLTLLTVALVHGAGNVVNTYYDYVRGIDGRNSDDRTLVDRILSENEVERLGAILYFLSFVTFFWLAIISQAKMGHLAAAYLWGLSVSFLYTGGFGFKYIALGDVIFIILFGPASVLFAYLSHTGQINVEPIYYAIPLALNTEAILHSNNTRDLESDRKVGIVTLAILIGRTASIIFYGFLLFTPYIMLIVFSIRCTKWFFLPLVTISYAFKIEREFRNNINIQSIPKRTAKLNCIFGILYIFAVMAADKSNMPFNVK
ncbi:ubiA prenyltransferase domain-containing protein 1 homolog [Daktulosphaira vitifoliae]|uniref:ubiA prenyltransferase domain-containing protein 1 homolog n=1 Tax=Daktulosphaira vitifoliae TaxID=58002 RepID=UPI0021A97ED0|nr:ubiA prenyltransferase domain-containing protein 1 homolog [Daktulosphaira vitifoliae]XP_050525083.1 ubiA prenyltransferase domain-containing protein 1 homolog [Daktulosphaira vitifoliae]